MNGEELSCNLFFKIFLLHYFCLLLCAAVYVAVYVCFFRSDV